MKTALKIIGALVLILFIIWLNEPTVYLRLKTQLHAKALWHPQYSHIFGCSWQWRCFNDFHKLAHRNRYFVAYNIFRDAYSRKPASSRLTRQETLSGLLSISAEILRALPQNAILITNDDNDTYPFWFVQQASNVRNDVTIISRHLWQMRRYRKFLWKTSPVGEVISRDSLLTLHYMVFEGDSFVDLSTVAHRLSRKYPVFVSGRKKKVPEFSPDSLYDMPIMGALYSPVPLPDSFHAEMAYRMLYPQNWNYIAENPPFKSHEEFLNSRAVNLHKNLRLSVMLLHNVNNDSLARRLLRKFDPWIEWNSYYLIMRPCIAIEVGDDPAPWYERAETWLAKNPHHWAFDEIRAKFDSLKVPPQDSVAEPQKSKPSRPKR